LDGHKFLPAGDDPGVSGSKGGMRSCIANVRGRPETVGNKQVVGEGSWNDVDLVSMAMSLNSKPALPAVTLLDLVMQYFEHSTGGGGPCSHCFGDPILGSVEILARS
jgi:hypothetical protein